MFNWIKSFFKSTPQCICRPSSFYQDLSNIDLIHLLRRDQHELSLGDGNEIVLIILERMILKNIIKGEDE